MLTTNELLHKKGKNIRRMFSSIAAQYDFLNALLSFTFDRRWRRFAVSVSGIQEGDKVLDVCTGTGDLAIEYAKAVNGKSTIVGTDFCDEMLRLATLKTSSREQGVFARANLVFIEADTLYLPFTDGSFQVSAVAFGIRNVADIGMGIREMARVVSPGGRVVILEFAEPKNKVFRWFYDFYFHKILPVIGRLISASRIDAYTYLPSSVLTFPDRLQLKALMESCGLEDVKFYPRTFGIVNIFVGKKPDSTHQPAVLQHRQEGKHHLPDQPKKMQVT